MPWQMTKTKLFISCHDKWQNSILFIKRALVNHFPIHALVATIPKERSFIDSCHDKWLKLNYLSHAMTNDKTLYYLLQGVQFIFQGGYFPIYKWRMSLVSYTIYLFRRSLFSYTTGDHSTSEYILFSRASIFLCYKWRMRLVSYIIYLFRRSLFSYSTSDHSTSEGWV